MNWTLAAHARAYLTARVNDMTLPWTERQAAFMQLMALDKELAQ